MVSFSLEVFCQNVSCTRQCFFHAEANTFDILAVTVFFQQYCIIFLSANTVLRHLTCQPINTFAGMSRPDSCDRARSFRGALNQQNHNEVPWNTGSQAQLSVMKWTYHQLIVFEGSLAAFPQLRARTHSSEPCFWAIVMAGI